MGTHRWVVGAHQWVVRAWQYLRGRPTCWRCTVGLENRVGKPRRVKDCQDCNSNNMVFLYDLFYFLPACLQDPQEGADWVITSLSTLAQSECCGSHPGEGQSRGRGRKSFLGRKIINVCRKQELEPHLQGKLFLHSAITWGFTNVHRNGGTPFIYPKPFARQEVWAEARSSFLLHLGNRLDPLCCRLLCREMSHVGST